MDSVITIVSSIASLLGLGGCGFLFFRQEKDRRSLENKGAEISNTQKLIDEWEGIATEAKERADRLDAKVDELRGKIDRLQDEITEHRNVKAVLREENAKVKVELAELRPWKCEVRNCRKRVPPSPVTMAEEGEDEANSNKVNSVSIS